MIVVSALSKKYSQFIVEIKKEEKFLLNPTIEFV